MSVLAYPPYVSLAVQHLALVRLVPLSPGALPVTLPVTLTYWDPPTLTPSGKVLLFTTVSSLMSLGI